MISNHKIQTALDEIKDISRIDLALYTEKGKPVAATFEPEEDLEDAITSFADSMAERCSQDITFLKLSWMTRWNIFC
jgi:carbohydrate diacid regulator